MPLTLISPPVAEPISLNEAKAQLRVDDDLEDALISQLIVSARQWSETYLQRALLTQHWELFVDAFSGVIKIPRPPLQTVVSIRYRDLNRQLTVLPKSFYRVNMYSQPGKVILSHAQPLPSVAFEENAIRIRFIAGYPHPSFVPADIKHAILMLVGHLYENREMTSQNITVNELPLATRDLLWPYRVMHT